MTTDIILDDEQKYGIVKASAWFNHAAYFDIELNKNVSYPLNKLVFTIAGYAGTGKSTLVKHLINQLDLRNGQVIYATYTGKAALVLMQKGNSNVMTLHKLLYAPVEVTEIVPQLDENGNQLYDENNEPLPNKIEKSLEFIRRDNYEKPLLYIVDEISMVPKDILDDLIDLSVPIITLGDPFQLPPVKNSDNHLLDTPDVFLVKAKRQALESGIIEVSMKIRENEKLHYGPYGKLNDTFIIPLEQLTDNLLLKADVILVGTNKLRKQYNSYMRELLGFSGELPMKNEKLVCLKNNNEQTITINENGNTINLVNGTVGYATKVSNIYESRNGTNYIRLNFKPEFTDNKFIDLKSVTTFFEENYDEYGKLITPEFNNSKTYESFDFGYCLTVNKYQGSEAKKVIVIVEDYYFQTNIDFLKWFYTAVTRAEEKLIIVIINGKYGKHRWLNIEKKRNTK